MVKFFSIVFSLIIISQIVFLFYSLKSKEKKDVEFIFIQACSILSIFSVILSCVCYDFGNASELISKICCNLTISFSVLIVALVIKNRSSAFSKKTHFVPLVNFISFVFVFAVIFMTFENLIGERFFTYVEYDVDNFFPSFSNFYMHDKVISINMNSISDIFKFFYTAIFCILGTICVTRIVTFSVVASVSDFLCLAIMFSQILIFNYFSRNGFFPIFEIGLCSATIPYFYFLIVFRSKTLFSRNFFRQKLFEQSDSLFVVFNNDSVLSDFNESAQKYFGFKKSDLYSLTMNQFLLDHVPLGFVSSERIFIEQISVSGADGQFEIFQIEFNQMKYQKNSVICSTFVFRNISSIVSKFVAIQQNSVVDNLTGLLSPHVLQKKIKEINLYRKFPYTVASCKIVVKNEKDEKFNPNSALVYVCNCIKNKIRETDLASYENGVIVLLFPVDLENAQHAMNRIVNSIKSEEFIYSDIEFLYGLSTRKSPDQDIQESITEAHSIMYNKNFKTLGCPDELK